MRAASVNDGARYHGVFSTAAAVAVCLGITWTVEAQDGVEGVGEAVVEAADAARDAADEARDPKPEQQAAPDVADDDQEPEPVEMKARLSYINVDRRLSFDNNGIVRDEDNQLRITMQCEVTSKTSPASYQLRGLDPVQTTGGQVLIPQLDDNANMLSSHRNGDTAQFSLSLYFPEFGQAKGKIRELAGTVRLEFPSGEKLRATLGPFKKIRNSRATLVGFDGDWIRIGEDNDDTKVAMNRSLYDRVTSVKFIDGDGNPINANSGGRSWSSSRIEQRYRVKLDDDATVLIDFHKGMASRDLKFSIKDVPLPAGENKDVFDMAIVPVPVKEARAIEAKDDDEVPAVELRFEGAGHGEG